MTLLAAAVVSVLVALARIGGATHPAFQAVAHLWVGGLIGYGIRSGWRVYSQAVALSVVEVIVFACTRLL